MAAGQGVTISVSSDDIRALGRALSAEEDGKALRKELSKNMRDALKPAVIEAKSNIMGMASGSSSSSPGLRPAIAKRIRAEVRLGGRFPGARVKARKTPAIRGFANAARRTNSSKGWRTQNFGNGTWRHQDGKAQWFDEATTSRRAEYRAAVEEAMDAMARRIAERSAG